MTKAVVVAADMDTAKTTSVAVAVMDIITTAKVSVVVVMDTADTAKTAVAVADTITKIWYKK